MSKESSTSDTRSPLVGVLSLQGAFEEHQQCLEAVGCSTVQVRTAHDLEGLDGIVLPGGESTAMGLIGTATGSTCLWTALKKFSESKPTWGTCAGMILLAEKCVGASAVIENGQSLIGGVDILVCRNYFGSQISSFEMATTPPPPPSATSRDGNSEPSLSPFPGIFIRAPAILSAGRDVTVLGTVVATPCRQAAVVLQELERKIENGENVVMMGVVDSLERKSAQEINYRVVVKSLKTTAKREEAESDTSNDDAGEEKKEGFAGEGSSSASEGMILELPGAADGTNARQVISAVRKNQLLCTAFHPELTKDYRWHEYFANMVRESL